MSALRIQWKVSKVQKKVLVPLKTSIRIKDYYYQNDLREFDGSKKKPIRIVITYILYVLKNMLENGYALCKRRVITALRSI